MCGELCCVCICFDLDWIDNCVVEILFFCLSGCELGFGIYDGVDFFCSLVVVFDVGC